MGERSNLYISNDTESILFFVVFIIFLLNTFNVFFSIFFFSLSFPFIFNFLCVSRFVSFVCVLKNIERLSFLERPKQMHLNPYQNLMIKQKKVSFCMLLLIELIYCLRRMRSSSAAACHCYIEVGEFQHRVLENIISVEPQRNALRKSSPNHCIVQLTVLISKILSMLVSRELG